MLHKRAPRCVRDSFCFQDLTGGGKIEQTYKCYRQKTFREGGTKRGKTREISQWRQHLSNLRIQESLRGRQKRVRQQRIPGQGESLGVAGLTTGKVGKYSMIGASYFILQVKWRAFKEFQAREQSDLNKHFTTLIIVKNWATVQQQGDWSNYGCFHTAKIYKLISHILDQQ